MNLKENLKRETQKRFLVLLSTMDLGGSAKRCDVLDNIERKEYFWPAFESEMRPLESTNAPAWRTDFSYTRKHLVTEGYMDDTIRGVWEVTDNGKKYLKQLAFLFKELDDYLSNADENSKEYHFQSSMLHK